MVVECNPHLLRVLRDSDTLNDRDNFICLDMNERVSAFSEDNFGDMIANITPKMVSSYPHIGPLYEKLASFTELQTDQLCLGAGSDSLIRRAFQAYLSPGDRLVTPEPTYGMYNVWARVFEAEHVTLPYSNDLTLDVDRFISKIGSNSRIVAIANPDQPTGHALSIQDIQKIAVKTADTNTLMLIDEAYFPFGIQSAQKLMEDYPHLLIVRSFSKAWGLAGLRVGYAMAGSKIIQALHAVRSPGEVNSVGAYMAAYLLDHPEIIEQFYKSIQDGRSILKRAAGRIGFEVPDCKGNFQLLRIPVEIRPEVLANLLKQHNYLIKAGFTHQGLKQCVRVTLDGPEIMNAFVETLTSIAVSLRNSESHLNQ